MYFYFIGLLLVAFQVTCYGAPEHLFPVPQLPADISQEEKHVEKRAVCTDDQLQESNGCGQWKAAGYCEESSIYYNFMMENCYATCGKCGLPPTQAPQPCTSEEYDQSSGCTQWKASGFCESSSQYYQFMKDNCYATCGYCIMPPTPVPQVDEDACLQAHNAKRALHQITSDLVWDATLAQHAKDWADHLAQNVGSLQHAQGTGEGENLYMYNTSGSAVKTCADAVEAWYNEVSLYDYNNPPQTLDAFYSGGYGHFTQVVWRGTTRVGAGLKKVVNSNGWTATFVVARYSPPGNMIGQFNENVKPLK